MKYLKTFENENYKVGDYVYIPAMYFSDSKARHGKIMESEDDAVPFDILFATGESMWCSKHQIFRKLNPEEIKKFEFDLASNKYNL